MQFKCLRCHYPEEDNTLKLIVEEGIKREFTITENGELTDEYSEGTGQDIYLECPVCGNKYDFDVDELIVTEKYSLRKFIANKVESVDLILSDYNYLPRP